MVSFSGAMEKSEHKVSMYINNAEHAKASSASAATTWKKSLANNTCMVP